jgi:hypothetical protein
MSDVAIARWSEGDTKEAVWIEAESGVASYIIVDTQPPRGYRRAEELEVEAYVNKDGEPCVACRLLNRKKKTVLPVLAMAAAVPLLAVAVYTGASLMGNSHAQADAPREVADVIFDIFAEKDVPEPEPEPTPEEAAAKAVLLNEEIRIPGYGDIPVAVGSTEMHVRLVNPEGNPCYFNFEIVLDGTGEVLYASNAVAPGDVIKTQQLSHALDEGIHDIAIRIKTTSTRTGQALNGAEVKTKLIVG